MREKKLFAIRTSLAALTCQPLSAISITGDWVIERRVLERTFFYLVHSLAFLVSLRWRPPCWPARDCPVNTDEARLPPMG